MDASGSGSEDLLRGPFQYRSHFFSTPLRQDPSEHLTQCLPNGEVYHPGWRGQPLVSVLLERWALVPFICSGGSSPSLTKFPHTLVLISGLWNTPMGLLWIHRVLTLRHSLPSGPLPRKLWVLRISVPSPKLGVSIGLYQETPSPNSQRGKCRSDLLFPISLGSLSFIA